MGGGCSPISGERERGVRGFAPPRVSFVEPLSSRPPLTPAVAFRQRPAATAAGSAAILSSGFSSALLQGDHLTGPAHTSSRAPIHPRPDWPSGLSVNPRCIRIGSFVSLIVSQHGMFSSLPPPRLPFSKGKGTFPSRYPPPPFGQSMQIVERHSGK